MAAGSKLDGFDVIARKLATLNNDMKTKTAWSAVSAAAQVVRKQAQANAAHELKPGPGRLVQNIVYMRRTPAENGRYVYSVGVRAGPHRRRGVKPVRKLRKGGGGVVSTYPNDPWYWFLFEFGFTHAGEKKRPFIKRPFITPALMSERGRALDAMTRRLTLRLRSVV